MHFKILTCTAALAAALGAAGCRTPNSAVGSDVLAGGPAQTRPGWLKSPEAIEGTIVQAWGIKMTDEDRWKYLQSIHSMLGGTLVLNTKSLVDQPNELLLLGLDNLSSWLAQRLIMREMTQEEQNEMYMFDGLGFSGPDSGNCFADDAKEWCDFQDGIKIDSLSKANVDVQNLSKEWKKRLMHNVQDIGEFMLLAIDNTLKVPEAQEAHAAEYLMNQVFLAHLKDGVTPEKERQAWAHVAYTILMSGGFYLEAPADTAAGEQP